MVRKQENPVFFFLIWQPLGFIVDIQREAILWESHLNATITLLTNNSCLFTGRLITVSPKDLPSLKQNFFDLWTLFGLSPYSPSLREAKAGTRGRNLEDRNWNRNHKGTPLTGLLWLAQWPFYSPSIGFIAHFYTHHYNLFLLDFSMGFLKRALLSSFMPHIFLHPLPSSSILDLVIVNISC